MPEGTLTEVTRVPSPAHALSEGGELVILGSSEA